MHNLVERLRLKMLTLDTLLLLSLLGLICGVVVAGVMIGFRQVIELTQAWLLPAGNVENYEPLSSLWIIGLPGLGGLVIGLIWQWLDVDTRKVGVVHVIERLTYHQGRLPWRNTLAQFVGAALSIISGHSVGREGPGIHLGAGSSSLLGSWLELPHHRLRTLVACGVAAAIAASFNTPIAGVIFAMEVVLLEYTLAGFTPIILSAVSATVITRLVYGAAPAFSVPALQMASLTEMANVLLLGLLCGATGAAFIYLLKTFSGWCGATPIWLRCSYAGIATGLIALLAPQVMGIGYDTVNQTLLGELGLGILMLIVVAKLLATTFGLGMGLPGGLIGPTLVIGAALGGAMGVFTESVLSNEVASAGFYAMLGMAAMMAATLQAPLAALLALLELTGNVNIILPGMLVVVSATLMTSEGFKYPSVFRMLLQIRGLDYRNDPISQSLRRIGVNSVMNRSFRRATQIIDYKQALELIKNDSNWVVVEQDLQPVALLPTVDLSRYIEQLGQKHTEKHIDLLEIPAKRLQLAGVALQASLQEAVEVLNNTEAEALYVWRASGPGTRRIFGILTRQKIETRL